METIQPTTTITNGESDLATNNSTNNADEAKILFATGKRHYLCQDYQKAIDDLSKCCELLVNLYGDLDYRCADAYLYYGKSLIELERLSQTLINVNEKQNGKTEDGESDVDIDEECEDEEGSDDDEDTPEDDNEIPNGNSTNNNVSKQHVSSANGENGHELNSTKQISQPDSADVHQTVQKLEECSVAAQNIVTDEKLETSGENEDVNEQPVDTCKNEAVDSVCDTVSQNTQPGDGNGENVICSTSSQNGIETDADENDQPGTSTGHTNPDETCTGTVAAWEVLDLARIIYEKRLTELESSDELFDLEKLTLTTQRLADVRASLGEVCVVDEKFLEAIDEFRSAQALLRKFCEPNDRRLAEIYFQIALTFELNKDFGGALENTKEALLVLSSKRCSLLKLLATDDQNQSTRSEIDDLLTIIKDIEVKLTDLEESQKSTAEVKNEMNELTKSPIKNASTGHDHPQDPCFTTTTDVSHLVRKPLKRASIGDAEVPDTKRPKVDGSENKENGCSAIAAEVQEQPEVA